MTARHEEPATLEQLAAAMDALGFYIGRNDPGEHAAEALRLGGADAYRMRLANALLGAVQTETPPGQDDRCGRRPAGGRLPPAAGHRGC